MKLDLNLPTTIPLSKAICLDIEADGFYDKVSKVHCMWIKDLDTGEKKGFQPHELEQGIKTALLYPVWLIHNGIDYDIPVIRKLLHPVPNVVCCDTLVLSRLLYPDRPGGHSLKSWGKRLGFHKGSLLDEDEDEPETIWEEYTPEMFEYCERDVDLLYLLSKQLISDINKWG